MLHSLRPHIMDRAESGTVLSDRTQPALAGQSRTPGRPGPRLGPGAGPRPRVARGSGVQAPASLTASLPPCPPSLALARSFWLARRETRNGGTEYGRVSLSASLSASLALDRSLPPPSLHPLRIPLFPAVLAAGPVRQGAGSAFHLLRDVECAFERGRQKQRSDPAANFPIGGRENETMWQGQRSRESDGPPTDGQRQQTGELDTSYGAKPVLALQSCRASKRMRGERRGGEGGGAIESIISVGLRALEHTRADVFARA